MPRDRRDRRCDRPDGGSGSDWTDGTDLDRRVYSEQRDRRGLGPALLGATGPPRRTHGRDAGARRSRIHPCRQRATQTPAASSSGLDTAITLATVTISPTTSGRALPALAAPIFRRSATISRATSVAFAYTVSDDPQCRRGSPAIPASLIRISQDGVGNFGSVIAQTAIDVEPGTQTFYLRRR